MRIGKMAAAAALAMCLGAAQPARAEFWEDAGWGSLTVLSNAFYMPTKILYSGLGGLTGGIAYGLTLGDLDVAEKIWVPSMGGTYALTPRMLRGEEEIAFIGGSERVAAARNNDDYRRPIPSGRDSFSEESLDK